MKNLIKVGILTHALWDKIIFKDFKKFFGGKIQLLISGSAPM